MTKKVNVLVAVLIGLLVMGLVGCGFSVGTSSKKEDHKDLFPDKNYSGSYNTSNMGYKYTLGDEYGEMMIYVDTSEGHSFEVVQPSGFVIKDKDGADALYGICLDKDTYAQYSAYCTDVKTINGRDFLYVKNGDGSEDCYTYVADCGMDCGLAIEVHDGNYDNFSLVAFRGEALPGASTDVHFYQGAVPATTSTGSSESTGAQEAPSASSSSGQALTNSSLSSDIENLILSLESDYNKVYWGARYSIEEEIPGVVASVTPCKIYGGDNGLVVAITNLYDEPVSFGASASAKNANDTVIGDTFVYYPCLGAGNTMISIIDCGSEMPDGRIHWEDISYNSAIGTYNPWEADWKGDDHTEDGYLSVDYDLYTSDGSACDGDMVYMLLLDESGFVLDVANDYVSEIGANEKYHGKVSFYGDADYLKLARGVAMFTNTTAK